MTTAISVRHLTKEFGTQKAVDDVTFDVPWDKVTGFLGPNGAGKTTTLRMVLGLAHPTSGEATVMGARYEDLTDPTGAVGALLETHQFHPGRTARNHLRAYAAAAGIDVGRTREVLDLVDLGDAADKKVGAFSLGMHQRLGLAGALLGDPKLLILDEPANGLDPAGIRWLRSFVRSFATGGRAVFLSSHLLGEISQIADDVVVIDRGRVVAHSPVSELIDRARGGVKARTDAPERLLAAMNERGIEGEVVAHDLVRLTGTTAETVGRAAAETGVVLFGLESEEGNLEDVFFELTTEGQLR